MPSCGGALPRSTLDIFVAQRLRDKKGSDRYVCDASDLGCRRARKIQTAPHKILPRQ